MKKEADKLENAGETEEFVKISRLASDSKLLKKIFNSDKDYVFCNPKARRIRQKSGIVENRNSYPFKAGPSYSFGAKLNKVGGFGIPSRFEDQGRCRFMEYCDIPYQTREMKKENQKNGFFF